MFPELLICAHGRVMSCWGLWQSATSLYPFTSCFSVCIVLCPFSQFGSLCMECVCVCLLCLCACALNLDHSVCLRTLLPQHLPPLPVLAFTPQPPISVFVCWPLQCLVHNLPTFSHFSLFGGTQYKGEKVAQFPPLGSQTPTETHPRSNTLSPHAQSLTPLSDLHMRQSSSLMHRHTVELFKSLKWGSP